MFSLATLVLAFVVGIAWGASAVWMTARHFDLAAVAFCSSLPAVAVFILRFVAEQG